MGIFLGGLFVTVPFGPGITPEAELLDGVESMTFGAFADAVG